MSNTRSLLGITRKMMELHPSHGLISLLLPFSINKIQMIVDLHQWQTA